MSGSMFSGFSPADPATAIPWREWDPALFEEDAIADQLRLLLVAPRWHSGLADFLTRTFGDERVVRRLAAGVTPISVDADARPDLAQRYSDVDRLTVAVLSPDGEVLEQLREPDADTLLDAVERCVARWRAEPDLVLAELETERVLRQAGVKQASGEARRGDLTPALLDIALARAADAHELAGAEQVRLWLYAHRRRADLDAERRARMAIQRRVDGGGFDEASGAFRRCAAPSAECDAVLAEDQGRWLQVLAGIAAEDSEAHEWVLQAVSRTIDFVEAELLNPAGGFAHHSNDERVFASSNALLARGLLACGIVFDRPGWRSRGRTAVDFLLRQMRAGEAGFYHVWDGVPHTLGLLGDQIAAGQALIDVYEFTGAADYLQHAQAVARLLERQFQIPGGSLADTDVSNEPTGLLDEPRFPALQNADAAELLIRLGHLTHDDRYVDMVYAMLGAPAGDIEAIDLEAACAVARVADRLLSVEPEVKIIAFAPPGEVDSIADPLHAEALRIALAAHTVQRLNPEEDEVLVAQLGVPAQVGGAICFVSGEYGSAVTRPDELLPAIERAISLPA